MTKLRADDGFTLVEMLVVCAISLVVFGATMTAFAAYYGQNRSAEAQSDNLDEARVALEREARQLRNLANPTFNATTTIYRATDYDFIFQTSDPAKTWVRYCLDTTGSGASPSAGRLWMSESPTSTLTSVMTGACGAAWPAGTPGRRQIVTQHVTNVNNGLDRNLFGYRCLATAPAGCPATSADYAKISTVTTRLWIDNKPTDRVKETDVSSAVYLRNQNEAPTAAVTGPSTQGPHKVSLNGMGSSDPEGRTLNYFWFLDSAPTSADLANCTATPSASVWEGPLFTKDFPVAEVGSTHNVWLVVRDPGCLTSTYGPVAVTVPS
jgi:prepilin-type N-terminal cleavage/methylation domain-containing protein